MNRTPIFFGIILAMLLLSGYTQQGQMPDTASKKSKCAAENEMCGGIAGILCCEGLMCQYYGNHPDAAGKCVKGEQIPPITRQDMENGWYFGDQNQKKPGTPEDWVYEDAGRSSCWHRPNALCGQEKTESLQHINSFDECAQADYPIAESYPRQCRTPDGRTFTEEAPPRKDPRQQCAREGEMCGGMAGVLCCSGLTCKLEGSYPDAGGVCVAQTEGQ